MLSLGLQMKRFVVSGSSKLVCTWFWDDSKGKHGLRPLVEKEKVLVGARESSTQTADAAPLSYVPFVALAKPEIRTTDRPPVFSTQIVTDTSSGYFVLGVSMVFPISQQVLDFLGKQSLTSFRVSMLLDSKWSHGTYTKPEGVKVEFHGFRKVHKTTWDVWSQVGDLFSGTLWSEALAQASTIIPVPHISISFNVEVIGDPGSVYDQDWDAIVAWDFLGSVYQASWSPNEPDVRRV